MSNWVRYTGEATIAQIRWGGNEDPRLILKPQGVYRIAQEEEHSWHTKIWVFVGEGEIMHGPFNSVHFERVDR